MKKHLFLLTTDITLDGGVERVVCNLANSFTRHNYDVDIISIFKSDNDVKYTVDNLVTVKYLFEEESYASFMRHVPLSKIQLIWRYLLAIKFTHPLYKYICSVLKPGQKGIILCNSYLITPLYRHKDIKIIGLDHSRYPFVGSVQDALLPFGSRFSRTCPQTVLACLHAYGSPLIT